MLGTHSSPGGAGLLHPEAGVREGARETLVFLGISGVATQKGMLEGTACQANGPNPEKQVFQATLTALQGCFTIKRVVSFLQ